MKVFITGGTGYIGEAVAIALRNNGHQVHALVRNAEKAKDLVLNEVNVHVGDLMKGETWKHIAQKCNVLIHAAADYTAFEASDAYVTDTFLELGKENPKTKTVIYTSGILVYPDSLECKNEDDPVDPNPFIMIKNRAPREVQVTQNKDVHGVVIRPGFVFGKKMAHFVPHFKQALDGKVVVDGRPNITWSEVHIDDLADAYVKVVEAAPTVVGGQIFNIVDGSRYSNLEIATKFARVAGFKGEIIISEGTLMPFFK